LFLVCYTNALSYRTYLLNYTGRFWQHDATKYNKHDSTDDQGDELNFVTVNK